MTREILSFLRILRTVDGVDDDARRIVLKYRRSAHRMSKEKGSSETDEPWKLPGDSSQQPEQKPPPKRDPERDYDGDKAQTS